MLVEGNCVWNVFDILLEASEKYACMRFSFTSIDMQVCLQRRRDSGIGSVWLAKHDIEVNARRRPKKYPISDEWINFRMHLLLNWTHFAALI